MNNIPKEIDRLGSLRRRLKQEIENCGFFENYRRDTLKAYLYKIDGAIDAYRACWNNSTLQTNYIDDFIKNG